MKLVPPKKKLTGSAQHIENGYAFIQANSKNILKAPIGISNLKNILFPFNNFCLTLTSWKTSWMPSLH